MPTFKQFLQEAWGIYQERPAVYLAFSALFALVGTLLTYLPAALFGSTGGNLTVAAIGSLVVSAVLFLLNLWISIALVYVIGKRRSEQAPDILSGFRQTGGLVFPYLWVSVLTGLALIGAAIPLILPAVILWIGFTMVAFVVVFERLGGLKALLRSRDLVKTNWEYVFWRVFVFAVLVGLVFMLIGLLLGVAGVSEQAASLVTTVLTFLVMPYIFMYMVRIYETLVSQKPAGEFKEDSTLRRRYTWLSIWGLVATVLFIVAVGAAGSLFFRGFGPGFGPGTGGGQLGPGSSSSQQIDEQTQQEIQRQFEQEMRRQLEQQVEDGQAPSGF